MKKLQGVDKHEYGVLVLMHVECHWFSDDNIDCSGKSDFLQKAISFTHEIDALEKIQFFIRGNQLSTSKISSSPASSPKTIFMIGES